MRDYYSYYSISPAAREKWLADIIERLKAYDLLLDGLKYSPAHLKKLHELLNAPLASEGSINPGYFTGPINLCNPSNLRELLSEIDFNLGLDIKRVKNFPVYFLFRYKKDTYRQHYVLLDEVYRSKNYPRPDQRFSRLRTDFSEKMFLDATTYRYDLEHLLRGKKKRKNFKRRIDFSLDRIAEVLNLAWDEDFELTRKLCVHLEIKHIVEAMELTHLILNTQDFSWLRDRPGIVRDFFDKKYEHPHLGTFLRQIENMESRQWTDRVDRAKRDYLKMKVALSRLFKIEVNADKYEVCMPLWKWVFMMHDKEMPDLNLNENLQMVRDELETVGEKVLEERSL